MPEQIIAAELHRDPDGSVYAIKFDGVTYLKARTIREPAINEQRSYTGVLHDRPVQTDPNGVYSRLWARLARKSREPQ